MDAEATEELIRRALLEDIGTGDHTSLATIPPAAKGTARLIVKQHGVLAGVDLARSICHHYDPTLHLRMFVQDGASVVPDDVAFTVSGPARSILSVERVLLNFMQRMSGIATLTRAFVNAVEGTGCTVLDTRKTTPTLRALEKEAVRIGGGQNHRFGLFDMIMIKDNHIDFASGIQQAIRTAQDYLAANKLDLKVEVEARDLREVNEVLTTGGVHRIMLDNFEFADLRAAVKMIGRSCETEASGGIDLQNARAFAECGVDFISVGALTHSARSLDLSLKAMS